MSGIENVVLKDTLFILVKLKKLKFEFHYH